ncbi:MAG: hypothetical protein JJ902_11315 [Roseibium sp.]|nr:hypothetical protein [Roseibium sp.]
MGAFDKKTIGQVAHVNGRVNGMHDARGQCRFVEWVQEINMRNNNELKALQFSSL